MYSTNRMYSAIATTLFGSGSYLVYRGYDNHYKFVSSATPIVANEYGIKFISGFLTTGKEPVFKERKYLTLNEKKYEVYEKLVRNKGDSHTKKEEIFSSSLEKYAEAEINIFPDYLRVNDNFKINDNFKMNITNLLPIFHRLFAKDVGSHLDANPVQTELVDSEVDFLSMFKFHIRNNRRVGILTKYSGVEYDPNKRFTIIGKMNGKQFIESSVIIRENQSIEEIRQEAESYRNFYANLTSGIITVGILSGCAEYYFTHLKR